MLNLIGTGLCEWNDLTIKGMNLLIDSEIIYIENYTSLFKGKIRDLEKIINKKVIPLTRNILEESDVLITQAKTKSVSVLIIGDPLFATTHTELVLRTKQNKIKVNIVHNASVFNAVSQTGLQLYKFGRIVSLPFQDNSPTLSVYKNISENKFINLHTLILLDIKSEEKRFMTVNQAIDILLEMEIEVKKKRVFAKEKWIGCARLGFKDSLIKYDYPENLLKYNFKGQPHCLIIPGKLHFIEEEFLEKI